MDALPPLPLEPAALAGPTPAAGISAVLILRFVLVGLFFAAIGYLVWKNWSRNFLWMGIAAIAYVLLFHLRYALIAHRAYSLASVTSTGELVNFTASTALVSLAIPWWVLFTYLGVFKMDPRRAAEIAFEMTFAVLLLLVLPLGWTFALNGALVNWTFPNSTTLFFGFLSILQIGLVSVLGIVLSAATAWFAHSQRNALPARMSSRRRG